MSWISSESHVVLLQQFSVVFCCRDFSKSAMVEIKHQTDGFRISYTPFELWNIPKGLVTGKPTSTTNQLLVILSGIKMKMRYTFNESPKILSSERRTNHWFCQLINLGRLKNHRSCSASNHVLSCCHPYGSPADSNHLALRIRWFSCAAEYKQCNITRSLVSSHHGAATVRTAKRLCKHGLWETWVVSLQGS